MSVQTLANSRSHLVHTQDAIGPLMLDIEGKTLTPSDIELLKQPAVGGVILFGRNVANPRQVRDLTDHMRQIRPSLLVAVDQEGGRVQRLKQDGYTPLPAMGTLGTLYNTQPAQALVLAETSGWLMATEVLASGIDFSFAPVLDVDGISQVIGNRGFHTQTGPIIALAGAFMQGMQRAGMATTGKHFPGHGSVLADSHIAAPVDERDLVTIRAHDMQPFVHLLPKLTALMPAHVIYSQVDDKPAGFSKIWLQTIIRHELGFNGVLFSDDLSMQAAHVAGGADARIVAALSAGCDMGLVCNDRAAALQALRGLELFLSTKASQDVDHALYNQTLSQQRLAQMRGQLRPFNGPQFEPDAEWQAAIADIQHLV